MIVRNPTKNDIEVTIDGISYQVKAEDQIKGVRQSHALHWKNKIHSFIELSEEGKDKVVAPEVAKIVEDKEEAEVEEVKADSKKADKKSK